MSRYIYRYEPFGSIVYDNNNGEILINKDITDFETENTRVINTTGECSSPISAPITVFLEVTKECNSRCGHCYNDSGSGSQNELSLIQWHNIIDDLHNNGVFNVKVTGGEPFYRSDIFEILEHIDSKEINFIIYSNGKLIDESCVSKLIRFKHLLCLRISIDGNKVTNDSIRGNGAFDEALDAVRILSRADIPCEINYTITKVNYNQIIEVANMIQNEDLKCLINIGMIKISGRAINNKYYFFFKNDDLIEALLKVKEQLSISSVIKPYYLLQPIYFSIFGKQFGCPAGRLTAMVNNEGNVFACGLFSENANYNCGNLLVNKFSSIWEGDKMNYIRNLPERDECVTCKIYKLKCTGACRGNALNYYGDICEKDINCIIYTIDFND